MAKVPLTNPKLFFIFYLSSGLAYATLPGTLVGEQPGWY